MSEQAEQVLAAFVFDSGEASRRFLKTVDQIDALDRNVRIVDAAIADRTKLGRVKIHQTEDRGGMTGGVRGGTLGVVVGALLLGPAGAVIGGAAGGILAGLHNRFHDIGIDDKFMRQVASEVEKGKSALFVLYEGDWSASIGLIEEAVRSEHALLIQSTLPPATAAALQQLVEPAVEELGGEEVVADYEIETAEEVADAAPVPVEPEKGDDLTTISGLGPKSAAVLTAAGVDSFTRLAATSEPELRRILSDAHASVPANVGTWSMQAAFAAKGDWRGLAKYDEMQTHRGASPAKSTTVEAKSATPPAQADDLTQLSGIGPRMASILADGGVTSYEQLQHTSTEDLRRIVSAGGALPPSSLDTWPTQASYAVNGDWRGLADYNKRHQR